MDNFQPHRRSERLAHFDLSVFYVCGLGKREMKVSHLAVSLSVALSGCAGINKSMTYSDVKHVVFKHPELPIGFWIFDRPTEGRMLINQDPGSAAGAGLVKGLTFGIADTSTPHQVFQQGANLWLQANGRPCTVSRIERVLAPTNYEAFYTCTAAELSRTDG
ncbi:MAG: hypothetical protein AB7S80_10270 [Rhizobiaceae bacterium]